MRVIDRVHPAAGARYPRALRLDCAQRQQGSASETLYYAAAMKTVVAPMGGQRS